jgi:[protein-PII] uridylyltransferase
MSSATGLKTWLVEARKTWQSGRDQLRELHDEGIPGRRIANSMSDLVDRIVLQLYESTLAELGEEGTDIPARVSLVMHGGCGRREFAPFSDVDLMILFRGAADKPIEQFARNLTQAIYDTGFALGSSLRTPRQACTMAMADAPTFSSLAESRFIGGSLDLYENYYSRLRRIAARRGTQLIRSIVSAREEERARFGETVYLLRPNVKRSRGGLRDIHLVRWLGFVRMGDTDIEQLCRAGALSLRDAARLKAAGEFLLRLRNELHFQAGRANDMLGKNEQVRIAEKWGYKGSDVSLPVEQFMRDYFFHTSEVRYASDHVVSASQHRRTMARKVFAPLMTRPLEDIFFISPFEIGVRPEMLDAAKTDLVQVLRLLHLSVLHSREIDQDTWQAIRDAMIESEHIQFSPETGRQFMALIRNPRQLGFMLRRLAEMRVLDRIIPPFTHARSLLQFNEYHQYTVDEHSIIAVEKATEFADDKGPLGNTYRALRDKSILHLALLIHDLGKGYPEDHCEVGRRLAAEICPRLGLDSEDADDVKFLVHNHLMMSHVAFQRDINDDNLVAEFAANTGSKSALRMLYLLTCADIAAVGPGTLTQWKFGLLTDLFTRAQYLLEGLHATEGDELQDAAALALFRDLAPDEPTAVWLLQQARSLPRNFSRNHPAELVAGQLLEMSRTQGYQAACWITCDNQTGMMELCIGRRVKRRSGIYYRITGMLAGEGLRIRTADIKHLADSFVWYWFQFDDPGLTEPPTARRLAELRDKAKQLAEGKEQSLPTFPRRWQDDPHRSRNLPKPPIKVVIDTQAVEYATVIDVFAWYKLGLLYMISRRIFELGLDVRFARIATFGLQAIQVFYVTDEHGRKVTDARKLVMIRRAILKETRDFLENDSGPDAGPADVETQAADRAAKRDGEPSEKAPASVRESAPAPSNGKAPEPRAG